MEIRLHLAVYTSGKPSLSLTLVKDVVCFLQSSEHSYYNIISSGCKYSAGDFNVHISSKMARGDPCLLVFIPLCVPACEQQDMVEMRMCAFRC